MRESSICGCIVEEDRFGLLGIAVLKHNDDRCFAGDARYSHQNYTVYRGHVHGDSLSKVGGSKIAYRVLPPAVKATDWVAGGVGLWWLFAADGEHVLYTLDEGTGYIAVVDSVTVYGATDVGAVKAGGVYAQFQNVRLDRIPANSTAGVVYFSAPKSDRVSIWPVIAPNVEGSTMFHSTVPRCAAVVKGTFSLWSYFFYGLFLNI